MKSLITISIIIAAGWLPVYAQLSGQWIYKTASETSNFYFSPEISMNQNRLSDDIYPDPRFNLIYMERDFRLRAIVGFNQMESFELVNPGVAVFLPGNIFIGPGAIESHPSLYSLSMPVSLSSWFRHRRFEGTVSLGFLNEEAIIDTPELITSGGNNLINWRQIKSNQTRSILSGSILYNLGLFSLGGGFTNASVFKAGSIDTTFDFSNGVSPYLILGYRGDEFQFQSQSFYQDFLFSIQKPLAFQKKSNGNSLVMDLEFGLGIGDYDYTDLNATVHFPLLSNFSGFIRYSGRWGSRQNFNNLDFGQWRESIRWDTGKRIVDYLPHNSLSAGIHIPLMRSGFSKIEILSGEVISEYIYTSKLEHYTQHPVAAVKIRNGFHKDVEYTLIAKSSDGLASYRTPVKRLSAGSTEELPIYFYYPFTPENRFQKAIQYNIELEMNSNTTRIASFNHTLLGPNSWNGDVADLSYFIGKDEANVRSRVKSVYVNVASSVEKDTALNQPEISFQELGIFLSTIGENVRYINDQVRSYTVDQVQYPLETLSSGAGDCEDLVVYLSAHLRNLGHDVSIVDLRPIYSTAGSGQIYQQDELGHLFLLVDTNIPVKFSGDLDLDEFSFLTRKNRFGRHTIWIPLETTVINEGFESAWKAGQLQYYHNIIKTDAVANGKFKLFDI